MLDLSIIIVNYRGWKYLESCIVILESFSNTLFTFEVIIVDNCSNDGKLEQFQKRFSNFRFILNNGNNGFSNGCNVGAAFATGTWLLFLNPDIMLSELAVYNLIQAIRRQPDITILSCRQKNQHGKEEQTCHLFPSWCTLNGTLRAVYRKIKKRELAERFSPEKKLIYPDWVSGSLFMISKKHFEQLGGWNEDYWLYYEDVDLCRRANMNGGKIGLLNQVSVIHHHGGCTRINPNTAALTKAEVIISRHVYLSLYFTGIHAISLHTFVILNTLTIKLLPALLGLPLFSVRPFYISSCLYKHLLAYYTNALIKRSWLSPRCILPTTMKSNQLRIPKALPDQIY